MSKLVQLKFSIAETKQKLKWKHSKEFEFEGHMYDIVSTERSSDGKTVYTCWPDHAENALNKKLSEMLSGILSQNPFSNKLKVRVIDFVKSLYHSNSLNILNPLIAGCNRIFGIFNEDIQYVYLSPPVPPPEST